MSIAYYAIAGTGEVKMLSPPDASAADAPFCSLKRDELTSMTITHLIPNDADEIYAMRCRQAWKRLTKSHAPTVPRISMMDKMIRDG
jgi:hypothetical protein